MFTSKDDPYHDEKKYHMADLVRDGGKVSALCFKRPRAINLNVALWTNRTEAVTCKKCLRLLAARENERERRLDAWEPGHKPQ